MKRLLFMFFILGYIVFCAHAKVTKVELHVFGVVGYGFCHYQINYEDNGVCLLPNNEASFLDSLKVPSSFDSQVLWDELIKLKRLSQINDNIHYLNDSITKELNVTSIPLPLYKEKRLNIVNISNNTFKRIFGMVVVLDNGARIIISPTEQYKGKPWCLNWCNIDYQIDYKSTILFFSQFDLNRCFFLIENKRDIFPQ